MKKRIPLVAAISDLSGYGRCALTATIPVLSSMGIQVCPAPTAILTAHTGYPHHIVDFTPHLSVYGEDWKASQLSFEAIFTGFLSNPHQGQIVSQLISSVKTSETLVLVDPVCGDRGKIYPCFTTEMVTTMKTLVSQATLITPNLTEGCLLTQTPFPDFPALFPPQQLDFLTRLGEDLLAMGPTQVVITGIPLSSGKLANFVSAKEQPPQLLPVPLVAGHFSGTGDLFASLLCGFLVQGCPLSESVIQAGEFIAKAAEYTITALQDDPRNGIAFEPFLHQLPVPRI